ncbi:hypothetical protein MNBD_BACTEROID01-1928 [hydrothermal vent metagenome]|uniref:Heavy metal binding domain-containing protein n=1 Tax=hydrothermal vent metagenome TaxID=652676 RepID=A0A3B0URU4_9ZZZZ
MKNLKGLFSGFGENTEPSESHSCCGGGGGGHSHHHSGGHSHHHSDDNSSAKSYKCPMNCEGGKTYDAPGNCPVCNMTLVPAGESHRHH